MDLTPSWISWTAIGLLCAAVAGQEVRVSHCGKALADAKLLHADALTDHAALALEQSRVDAKKQFEQAVAQQKTESLYVQKKANLRAADIADTASADRLRSGVTQFTRLSSAADASGFDAATDRAAGYRLERVGILLAQSVGLEAESRAIINVRDAEVIRLIAQITIDRSACAAGDAPAGPGVSKKANDEN